MGMQSAHAGSKHGDVYGASMCAGVRQSRRASNQQVRLGEAPGQLETSRWPMFFERPQRPHSNWCKDQCKGHAAMAKAFWPNVCPRQREQIFLALGWLRHPPKRKRELYERKAYLLLETQKNTTRSVLCKRDVSRRYGLRHGVNSTDMTCGHAWQSRQRSVRARQSHKVTGWSQTVSVPRVRARPLHDGLQCASFYGRNATAKTYNQPGS